MIRVPVRAALLVAAVLLPATVAAGTAGAAVRPADTPVPEPATFTSTATVTLTPEAVRDDSGAPVPGQSGASGTATLRMNSQLDVVCYEITVTGLTPPFASAARTAVHLQEGGPEESGNPRLVLPEPTGAAGGPQTGTGCVQGPFTTGVIVNGADTGTGFTLAQVEANPAGWFLDVHTEQFRTGALRGQLTPSG